MREAIKKPWNHQLKTITREFTKLVGLLTRYEAREQLIREIDKTILQVTSSAKEVYNIILNEGIHQIGAQYGHILTVFDQQLEVIASNSHEAIGKKYEISKGLVGRAVKNAEIVNVADVSKESDYIQIHKSTKSELVIPMKARGGAKILGVFNIEKNKKGKFNEEEIEHCDLLVGQVVLAIEQVKLWNGIELISKFNAELLSGEKSPSEIYHETLDGILRILDFEYGQIMMLDPPQTQLRILADSKKHDYVNSILDSTNSISGYFLIEQKGRKPLLIPDLDHPEFRDYKDKYWGNAFGEDRIASMLLVPLVSGDKTVGLLDIEDRRKNAFTEFDQRIITILSDILAESIEAGNKRENKILEERSSRHSFTLTQMGVIALDYSHKMGGIISGIKGDLNYFVKKVNGEPSQFALPSFSERSGISYLNDVIKEVERAHHLVTSLRENFNPERIDKERIIVDIISEIYEISKEFRKNKDGHELHIVYNKLDEGKITCALTSQFREIIIALINNAFEASFKNETGVRIYIGFKHDDLYKAEITVEDQGEGIPEDQREKIFEFGYTTKKNRHGQGLGMWFVKFYVEYFGGDICVHSIQNKGTKVTLTFPLSFKPK